MYAGSHPVNTCIPFLEVGFHSGPASLDGSDVSRRPATDDQDIDLVGDFRLGRVGHRSRTDLGGRGKRQARTGGSQKGVLEKGSAVAACSVFHELLGAAIHGLLRLVVCAQSGRGSQSVSRPATPVLPQSFQEQTPLAAERSQAV